MTSTRRHFLKGVAATAMVGLSGCIQYCQSSCDPSGSGGSGFGTDGASERFYQTGPPSRSGETINATDYSSLQAAHDVLQPDDTLFLPASDDPYRDRLDISQDHITVASDGARLEQPDDSENYAIASDRTDNNPDTELAAAHEKGAQTLTVADASAFSPDDDIYIREGRRPYGKPPAGGFDGAGHTREYRTVTGVSDDELALNYPLLLPFPNTNPTEVGGVEWAARDVRITGLTIEGTRNTSDGPDASRPIKLFSIRDGWIDHLTVEGAGRYSLGLGDSYHCRLNDIVCQDGLRYGTNIHYGSTSIYCTGIEGHNLDRYALRFGPHSDGPSTTDCRADGVYGSELNDNEVTNAHDGAFFIDWSNVIAKDESAVFRMRTGNVSLDGFTGRGSSSFDFRARQVPMNITVSNGSIVEKQSGPVFSFDLRGDDSSGGGNRRGNEYGENLVFENIEIEPYGRDITDIITFDEGAVIDGLEFRNITYGGERLTRQHVEQADGYAADRITNLVVE